MSYIHRRTGQTISSSTYHSLTSYEKSDFKAKEDFTTSAVVGAVTDSAILGTLVGGSILGAVVGDLFDGSLFD